MNSKDHDPVVSGHFKNPGVRSHKKAWSMGHREDCRFKMANCKCEMWEGIEHRVWSIESDTLYLNSWLLATDS